MVVLGTMSRVRQTSDAVFHFACPHRVRIPHITLRELSHTSNPINRTGESKYPLHRFPNRKNGTKRTKGSRFGNERQFEIKESQLLLSGTDSGILDLSPDNHHLTNMPVPFPKDGTPILKVVFNPQPKEYADPKPEASSLHCRSNVLPPQRQTASRHLSSCPGLSPSVYLTLL